jgi:hypothetical protein
MRARGLRTFAPALFPFVLVHFCMLFMRVMDISFNRHIIVTFLGVALEWLRHTDLRLWEPARHLVVRSLSHAVAIVHNAR